ncbi:MAG: AAA family ATPase [Bacteroidales bacterium]|nr:AAA family ATPase [Bacteroidales bacterium]
MISRSEQLYNGFLDNLGFAPTACQDRCLGQIAGFVTSDDSDIMVLSGFAGTGKTTMLAAVVKTLEAFHTKYVLLAPTGRAAKVIANYSGRQAFTIHKHIYRQKSVGDNGLGLFSISPNKAVRTLFIVDEASLIGGAQGDGSNMFGTGDLLSDLIGFVRSGAVCKLLLVGDKAQLPPVGLDDSPALNEAVMAGFGGTEFASMTTVVRQSAESGILANATRLREVLFEEGAYSLPMSELNLSTRHFTDIERITGGDLLDVLYDAYGRYGDGETMVLCRSNKMANRYNAGIRAKIQYKEEDLVKGDKLMVVKNCYQLPERVQNIGFIANGDVADLLKIGRYEERYGLHFATARLSFPDYDGEEMSVKVCLDALSSETPALTYEQQNALYSGVNEDYAHITSKRKRYEAVKEDSYFSALQIKYAYALTCHKAQGGQWKCVFIDNPFWQDVLDRDQLRWLYTALTRATEKVYLVNFNDKCFK